MEAKDDARFESDCEDDAGEGKEAKFVKDELAKAGQEGKNFSVDERTLEGRKAKRGFTIGMGKKVEAEEEPLAAGAANARRSVRAQTLPALSGRRGDFIITSESQAQLHELNKTLKARFRRGSTAVAVDVVPEEELQKTWSSKAVCHVVGKMTEGQVSADERLQEFFLADGGKSPFASFAVPPIISCTKGCKGRMDTTPNQDNYSITRLTTGHTIACCFDGHGPYGHFVSTRTVKTVPYYLVHSANFPDDIEKALVESFERSQKDIVAASLQEGWDCLASGSTAVACVWKDNVVWTANAGDSRLVIGTRAGELLFETDDHKPDTPAEQARIEASGGEVRSQTYPDGWTVHRIFVRGQGYPGLCMARTLGDHAVKDKGVVETPDTRRVEVDMSKDPFILLASDGVWEFLESRWVVKAMAKKIPQDGAERTVMKLQREARKRWKQEEGEYCDDITTVFIPLGDKPC